MLSIKQKINSINNRLDVLKNKDSRIILEFITEYKEDNCYLWHILKVVNSYNQLIYKVDIKDEKPRHYIDDAINKYNCIVDYEFYNIIDGQKIKVI